MKHLYYIHTFYPIAKGLSDDDGNEGGDLDSDGDEEDVLVDSRNSLQNDNSNDLIEVHNELVNVHPDDGAIDEGVVKKKRKRRTKTAMASEATALASSTPIDETNITDINETAIEPLRKKRGPKRKSEEVNKEENVIENGEKDRYDTVKAITVAESRMSSGGRTPGTGRGSGRGRGRWGARKPVIQDVDTVNMTNGDLNVTTKPSSLINQNARPKLNMVVKRNLAHLPAPIHKVCETILP